MQLKQGPEDFRVVEQIDPKRMGQEGPHWVYRVAKRKLTTLEAIDLIAKEARVEKSEVSFAGLKDRQGVTVQYVSIQGGNPLVIDTPDLKVSVAGRSTTPINSDWLQGNLFDIVARDISPEELSELRGNFEDLRRFGVPNYFDDQRFGCVRHGQGFIVRDMIRGDIEGALRKLVCAASPFDSPEEGAFKADLRNAWGDWPHCVGLTKRRQYESLFEHLAKHPKDFIGAFFFIAARIRLIHLYSYQSYLWDKSVSLYLKEKLGAAPSITVPTDIGPLNCHRRLDSSLDGEFADATFPILDSNTEFKDEAKRRAVEAVLRLENLKITDLKIEGIPGFVFKGEERKLMLKPTHIRVKTPAPDDIFRGKMKVEFRFGLPPGSYASLVMKRLFALPGGPRPERSFPKPRKQFNNKRTRRP